MTSPKDSDLVDTTIHDIHKIREEISDKFGGDVAAILADARERQEKSGRRVIYRGELHPSPERSRD